MFIPIFIEDGWGEFSLPLDLVQVAMRLTQFFIFEISNACNLAIEHAMYCPYGDPLRYVDQPSATPMSDRQIVEAAVRLYRHHGFRGAIGFHFYNEPTLAWDRMMRVMDAIKQQVAEARFGLLTNGTLLTPDLAEDVRKFWRVEVTNYQNRDYGWLEGLGPIIDIGKPWFDKRLYMPPTPSDSACGRIFNEAILDFFGNCHPCCMDWRGELPLGNLHTDGLDAVIANYQKLRALLHPLSPNAPAKCRECFARCGGAISNIVPEIAADIRREVER